MTARAYRTNPTRIQCIDRSWLSLTVRRNSEAKIQAFSVNKLDLTLLDIPKEAPVFLLAYSGFDELRVNMGTVGDLVLPKDVSLDSIDTAGLIFRLFVTEPKGHSIIASREGIRAVEEDGEDRAHLLHIHYEPLGERLWDLRLSGGERPILRVSDNPDLDMRSLFETRDPMTRGLIVPQAFEQALLYLVLNPASDEDSARWQNIWAQYLRDRGVELPDAPSDVTEIEGLLKWARETAARFAQEIQFVSKAVSKKHESLNAKSN